MKQVLKTDKNRINAQEPDQPKVTEQYFDPTTGTVRTREVPFKK